MSEPTSVAPVQSGRGLAQLNPAPEQLQRFSLRVVGAPGPFAEVQATAQYDVSNEAECGHINPASGTAERITSQETLSLQPAADGSWHGEVALDLLQDQDYYGRGVCRWALTEVRVRLRATGADGETRFVAALPLQALQTGSKVTRWFWNGGYPRSEAADYPDMGMDSPQGYRAELRDALFAVELNAGGV